MAIGYILNANDWGISIHEAKVRGARSFILPPYLNSGNRILPMEIVHELRGNIAHWSETGWIWNRLVQPRDRMLSFCDVSGLWIRCNDINAWSSFWHVLHFARQIAAREEDWARMFTGQMTRLLPIHEALSGPRQTIPILWTSGDAAHNRIGAFNWRTREFSVEDSNGPSEPFFGITPKGIHLRLRIHCGDRIDFIAGVNISERNYHQCHG